jgi:diguanylate cyclase
MGFFSRKKPEPVAATSATSATDEPVNGNGASAVSLTDDAIDTIADFLRLFGQHAFPLDSNPTEEFTRDCEAWARHITTGIAQTKHREDGDMLDAEQYGQGERDWAGLRFFLRNRRREEEAYVGGRLSTLKNMIWDMVSGLRNIAVDGEVAGGKIEENLLQLESAAKTGSLDTMQAIVASTVNNIRRCLAEQRAEFDKELASMGKRLDTIKGDLLEAERQLELDPLTELYNRGAFDQMLSRYVGLGALSDQTATLMLVDLDHFKQINDTYGHPAGDQVLRASANALVRTFPRNNDFVCRYGGEEFAIILLDVAEKDLLRISDRVLAGFRKMSVELGAQSIGVTCSVGCARLRKGESTSVFLGRVDEALYVAKDTGRDRAVIA